ncbi:sulfurtransferase [Sphingomonas hengshuiensis]|uniref:Sulfurtransferase n=1 Tax=Sphingomonas hengshuiensis TaxID=1609977 RepID=A0A7U4LG74_9SPHN|nr:sulfurtransferase [Sphingomonas hengshuiensis]AJP73220.1 3-mercaptopyruvate sulfurtransferase [Sphingomonas hengshuiensis]
MDALVTTDWLAGAIGTPGLLLLDASYTSTLPGSPPRDPRADYAAGHVPGARFLDLDTLVDATDPLPSMLPPAHVFAARMAALGWTPESHIVLYDDSAHHTSCRAWWVLRMYGVDAKLLDGGIAKWRAEGRPLDTAAPAVIPTQPLSVERGGGVRDKVQMLANLASAAEQVVDARSAARFTGEEPDPRADCGSGHIPGSRSLPYTRLFEADGSWKSPEALAQAFADAGIELDRPLVASCGSGITAAVLVFAAHLLGHDAALYDGSWTEWGADPATPKALGPA